MSLSVSASTGCVSLGVHTGEASPAVVEPLPVASAINGDVARVDTSGALTPSNVQAHNQRGVAVQGSSKSKAIGKSRGQACDPIMIPQRRQQQRQQQSRRATGSGGGSAGEATSLRVPPTSPCKVPARGSWAGRNPPAPLAVESPQPARRASSSTGTNTPGRMTSKQPARALRTVGSGPDLLAPQQVRTITVSRRRPASARPIGASQRSATATASSASKYRSGSVTPVARSSGADPMALPARQRLLLSDTKENGGLSTSLSLRLSGSASTSQLLAQRRRRQANQRAQAAAGDNASDGGSVQSGSSERASSGSPPMQRSASVPPPDQPTLTRSFSSGDAIVGAVGRSLAQAATGTPPTAGAAAVSAGTAAAPAGALGVVGGFKRRRSPPLVRVCHNGWTASDAQQAVSTPPAHPASAAAHRRSSSSGTGVSPGTRTLRRTPPARAAAAAATVEQARGVSAKQGSPARRAPSGAETGRAVGAPGVDTGSGSGSSASGGMTTPPVATRLMSPRAGGAISRSVSSPSMTGVLTPSHGAHRRAKKRVSATPDVAASPVREFLVLDSASLTPVENPEGAMEAIVLPAVSSMDWSARYNAIETVRRLVTFHPDTVIPHLSLVLPAVTEAVASIRSAMSRNAIFCVADMFSGLSTAMAENLHVTATVLLRRAAHDKGFLRDASNLALKKMVDAMPTESTLGVLLSFCQHRSPGVCGRSAHFADLCVAAMGAAVVRELDLSSVLVATSRYNCGKSADSRAAARRMIHRLSDAVGKEALEAAIHASGLSKMDALALVRFLNQPKRRSRDGGAKSCLRDRIKQRRRQMHSAKARTSAPAASKNE